MPPVIVTIQCPKCGHHHQTGAYTLFRRRKFTCEECGSRFETKPTQPKEQTTKTTIHTKDGKSYDFEITLRGDGVWHFDNENERAVAQDLDNDSDRAVGVIAAALIETRLKAAILCRCKHIPDAKNRLFNINGPMGSFGVQIDLAYIMGLLTKESYQDLVIIKDVRNAFAHNLDIKDFDSSRIKDKISNLSLINTHVGTLKDETGKQQILKLSAKERPVMRVFEYQLRKKTSRERYIITTQLLSIHLALGKSPTYPLPLI